MDKKKMQDTIQEIDACMELFYQQKNQDAFTQFSHVLTKMTELIQGLFEYKEQNSEFILDENQVVKIVNDAMHAMEEKDYILLADIIQYDFKEYISELINQI